MKKVFEFICEISESGKRLDIFLFEKINYLETASVSWLSEKKDFLYSKIGDTKNNFSEIGHYTQMVWYGTPKVGIAYSKSKSGTVYVGARYYPAGNVTGQHPY